LDQGRFLSGLTFDEYLAKMEPENQHAFEESYRTTSVPQEIRDRAGKISTGVHVFAATESWCPDCRVNLPALVRLCECLPGSVLRCHPRDASQDLGVQKIPTFILYDPGFREIGRWIERPQSFARIIRQGSPQDKRDARRGYFAGAFRAETLSEVMSILEMI